MGETTNSVTKRVRTQTGQAGKETHQKKSCRGSKGPFQMKQIETSVDNGTKENDALWLNDVFTGVSLNDITCAAANITYYVNGYVGRSIACRRKWFSCKELLIAGDDSFSTHPYLPDEYKKLYKNLNRGGLSQPSEFIYTVITLAVQHYMVILFIEKPTKPEF